MNQSAILRDRQDRAVPKGVATKSLYVTRAENAELWDVDGRRYIDFAAGIAVVNTGHRHPKVMAAVAEQAAAFTHTSFNVGPFEGYIRLAERLNAMAPGSAPKQTLLVTTGAEAVENAVKIARAATGRSAVIAFTGAFHGRTLLALALTGKVVPYKRGFGPFPAEVYHAPFPHLYHGISVEDALAGLERLLASDVDPARVAAMIVEPVQGEGGFIVAPPAFLQGLRRIADAHGMLLIVDEIQAGMARTGKMFAVEHAGVVPDLITTAKGLAGGFPLAAVTGRADVMSAVQPGGLGGTYAGNPVSVAAANAVLDVIAEEHLCERATEMGKRITERLHELSRRQGFECIGEVRGLGAMVAMELVKDRASRAPDPALAAALLAEAQKRGLVLLSCGPNFNVIRILAPLTTPMAQIDEGLGILAGALEASISAVQAAA